MKIVFASSNKGKIKEVKELLKESDVEILSLEDIGFTGDIVEDGTTFEENAGIKAKTVCKFSGLPAVADDSGLVIDALDGRPGVYSARYGGYDTSYDIKLQMLLDELKDVPKEKRTARYEAAVYCAFPDGKSIITHGTCEGWMGYEPKGENGFGYDPLFMIDDTQTMAQISDQAKNAMSHRGKAVREFAEKLKEMK